MQDYQAKQAMKQTVVAALQAARPELIPGCGCVNAAKNIRIQLKAAFPGVKFSVKTSSYSGGNNIDIRWTDGATVQQVNEITREYALGSFDGMTDSYEYDQSNYWTDAFGGTKYISNYRYMSDEFLASVLEELSAKWGTIDGVPCPTIEQYRTGNARDGGWDRRIGEAASAKVAV